MTESVKLRMSGMPPAESFQDLFYLMIQIQADLSQLATLLSTHVHSGVTVGAGNTAAPTTTILPAQLNVQP